ncbi:MAG: T9SS type A sorting domain-containing protein [Candidatus Marinimicrobia bacterium]|nr:T9SS type A sorting domain-containing protein [Candidatus Neomarinimicrobiota bacterium]
METGTTDRTLIINAFATSATASGTYTVQVGDDSRDLTVNLLSLLGGSLRDVAGNAATYGLPATSNLDDNSAIDVDGIIPFIESVTSSSDDSDPYGKDGTIQLIVTFSEEVSLSAGETLVLDINSSTTDIQITSISNSITATVEYVVLANDASADLNIDDISLIGPGTLQDAAGNDVSNLATLAGMTTLGDAYDFVIDGILPPAFDMVSGVTTGPNIIAGYWNELNEGLSVTVTIPNDVSLQGGSLQILGRIAGNPFAAVGAAVNIPTVNTPQQVLIDDSILEIINGFDDDETLFISATLADVAGNSTTANVLSIIEIDIDRIAPTITQITSITNDGSYSLGEVVNVTVALSENVTLNSGALSVTLNIAPTPRVLTDNAIASESSISYSYTIQNNELANPLTVTGVTATANQLLDVAGNEVDFSLPVANNLADNSTIIVDGEFPSIVSISSAVVIDTLGLGETIDIDIEFNEDLILTGGTFDITLGTGQTIPISAFTASTTISATYTVAVGEASADLNVTSVALSAGTLQDIAGNALPMTLPVGANLGDNNNILVDGIVPVAFTTGNILTLGAPVVTNYWNDLNTGLQVILPNPGTDLSLNGGSARLQARVDANAYVNVGGTVAVTTNATTLSLTQGEIESGVPGYFSGSTLDIRGVYTDIAGNSTQGSASVNRLTIDIIAPNAVITGAINTSGGTVNPGYWNATNSQVGINIPIPSDISLQNGNLQLQADIDGANLFQNIGSDSTITSIGATHVLTLSAANLTSFGAVDGNELTFRAMLTDVAGNVTSGSIGANSLIMGTTIPVIVSISSAEVIDTLGLGESIDIDIEFNETLTLSGGTLDITLGTGQTIPISTINSSSSTSATYTVAVGETSADLNVTSVSLSSGTLLDIAGNALVMTLPVGANLADNNTILVDGIVPADFATGNILTVGAPVVTGYWNALNTGLQVILPVTGSDASLNGGRARLEARINSNAFESIGIVAAVGTNPVTLSLSRAQLEADLAGYLAGGTIQIQGVLTDIAGNATTGSVSTVELIIDQVFPTQTETGDIVVSGGTEIQGYWNPTNTNLRVSTDLDNDNSLLDGVFQLEMQVGAGAYQAVGPDSTINTNNATMDIDLSAVDLNSFVSNDGATIRFRALVTDVAGNFISGTEGLNTITVDLTPPTAVTVGTVTATTVDGVVVANAFNGSNDGISVTIPILNDATLMGGTVVTQIKLGAQPYVDVDSTLITAINTTQEILLDSTLLSGLTGWANGISLLTSVELIDRAGNETQGNPSSNQLFVDRTPPAPYTVTDYSPVGGVVADGYWNASNTSLEFTVPIDATDLSLLNGEVQAYAIDFTDDTTLVGSSASVTSLVPVTLSISESEIESLNNLVNGLGVSFFMELRDRYGNVRSSNILADALLIDMLPPVAGSLTNAGDLTGTYINADDTLSTLWSGFSDLHSGINYYDFSIGNTTGVDDFLAWDTLEVTHLDTQMLYTHADEYYLNVRAYDVAGNVSTIISSPAITADLVLPTTSSDMERYYFVDEWPGTLFGFIQDNLSGVESADMILKRASDGRFWNGSAWSTGDSLLSLNIGFGAWNYVLAADSLENREDYIMYLMGQDIAGNRQSSASPFTATVDTIQFVENQAPFFVDGAAYSGSSNEDSQYTRIYLADDEDLGTISSDTLYYSLADDAPDGVAIDERTGQLTWLPVDSAVGIHNFTIYVVDDYSLSDTLLVEHEVLEVNDAPEPVTLLLPADSTQLVPEDSLLLTFSWTSAFDIEDDVVAYRVYFQGGSYSNVLGSPDTFLTVDVSVMDFPVDTIEWFVEAYDQEDVSAIDTIFHFNTSAALAELNTDSIAVDMVRHTDMDTLFVMSNLGLTDLQWTLLSAPSWITLSAESGTIVYQASSDILFNIDLAEFSIGGYGGDIMLTTNDPLHDTIKVDVTMEIFEIPAPVIAFYKNLAYPAFYELMIVDSLGMIEDLSITHAGEELEITEIDTFSYVATVEVASEGQNSFVILASNWVGDTTITASITVSLIKRGAGWLARSPDKNFEIQGNAKSVLTGSRITILDSLLSATDHARYKVLTDGVELAEPVRVSMPVLGPDLAIYRQHQNGEFYELPSISDGERVTAWAEQMSAFKTGPRTIIVPERSQLSQNYPNPFNPSTTIDFDIGFLDGLNQDVEFSIYNIRGQEVKTLMETQLQPGSYSVSWNGLDDQGKQVSSGIYFARLMTGKGYVKTVKMLVLR